MKNFKKGLLSLITLMLCLPQTELKAQFTIAAETKTRLEIRDGYRVPALASDKAAAFVGQRTRLIFAYTDDKMSFKISPQDIRVWGDEYQLGKRPSFGLHEAWAQINIKKGWGVKLGRQEIVYDDHRLMGNVDWVLQARSHDALILNYIGEGLKMDFGGSFNQLQENTTGINYLMSNYKVMAWYFGQKQIKNFTINTIFHNDAFESDSTHEGLSWKHTLGGGVRYKKGKIELKGDAYWQGGKLASKALISAYLLAIKADYNLEKVTFSVGADIISGDNPNDQKFQAFNTLYATNHKFYGFMDYYLNIPNDTKGGGLQDFNCSIMYNANTKTSIQLDFHQFFTDKKVYDKNLPSVFLKKNLGSELDFVVNHTIRPYAKLSAGVSTYFATTTTDQIRGGDKKQISYWGFAMLTLKPEFLNTDKLKNKLKD